MSPNLKQEHDTSKGSKRRHPMTEWVEKGFRLAVCYDATEHGERCHFSSLRVAVARRLALIDVGATSAFAWSVK